MVFWLGLMELYMTKVNRLKVILRKIYKHQDQVTTFYNITFESKDVSWLSNYEKEIITQHFIKELLHPFEELKWKAIQKITGLTIPTDREFRCVQR